VPPIEYLKKRLTPKTDHLWGGADGSAKRSIKMGRELSRKTKSWGIPYKPVRRRELFQSRRSQVWVFFRQLGKQDRSNNNMGG